MKKILLFFLFLFIVFILVGARYLVNGEIQYIFDFEHPCGINKRGQEVFGGFTIIVRS